jgi:3-phosphoshikimate 1-carboxyvinyltransferase
MVEARPRAGGAEASVASVAQATRLRGDIALPGDKSISHRALMLALLARGESRIRAASDGADVRSTAAVIRALGAAVTPSRPARGDGGRVDYVVSSPGAHALGQPGETLDCGNSGTTLRLFAGILAGLPLRATLDGDASLRGRPVARIIEPLRAMGAVLSGRRQDSLPPVTVVGHTPLQAVDWTTSVPSAQVKSAILLAGLRADGTTRVRESVATRDHTERMLRARGVTVRSIAEAGGGATIEIEGGADVQTMETRVPGDPSAAAFWLVAGAIHPDAELHISGVGVNPTRRGAIDLLRAMGAAIDETNERVESGEPIADLAVRSSSMRGIDVAAADTARAIDEIPVLCLAATQASGTTRIRGAGELRVKESDRIAGIVGGLRALGADIDVDGDDLVITGPARLRGVVVESLGDHRLAMTFAIGGLIAQGSTTVLRAASAAISDPGFFGQIEEARA